MADMQIIRDRITKALTDATREMSPTETLAQTGRAAAQAATTTMTFGDALNAQKAESQRAMQQLQDFFNKERQSQQADRGLDLQQRQLDQDQANKNRQFGLDQRRLGIDEENLNLSRQESARADKRLGLDQRRLDLDRDQLLYEQAKDAADRGDEDAKAVVTALETLVPEEQRATYAAALGDLSSDVNRNNVVAEIGRIRRKLEASGKLPAGEEADIKDVASQRKEFSSLSKNFIEVKDAYARILASQEKPSPAGDLSMIFNYMKMLDPGSTVRESEFSTASNAAPILERMGISFDKVSSVWEGKMLTDNQRQDFLQRTQVLFKAAVSEQDRLAEGYRGIAKRNRMKPEDVVIDFAGPLRWRAMDDDELQNALANAGTKQAVDNIMEEFKRRAEQLR